MVTDSSVKIRPGQYARGATCRCFHSRVARLERTCADESRRGHVNEPLQMLFRPIPFMGEKIIIGIGPMVHLHHAITRDFGHDRRGSNRQRQHITLNDRA